MTKVFTTFVICYSLLLLVVNVVVVADSLGTGDDAVNHMLHHGRRRLDAEQRQQCWMNCKQLCKDDDDTNKRQCVKSCFRQCTPDGVVATSTDATTPPQQ